MEMKLVQKLSRVDHKNLFLVFIKLRKTYDTIDRGRLIQTLEGYGAGPRLCEMLETFLDCQQVVLRQNGFHRPTFTDTRGTAQGGPLSLMLFNMVVDNIIRTWLAMIL